MLLSLSSLFLAFGLSEWPQAWLPYTPALSHPHAYCRAYACQTAYLWLHRGACHPYHKGRKGSYCGSGRRPLAELVGAPLLGTRIDKPPPDEPLLGFPFPGAATTAFSFDLCLSLSCSIMTRSVFLIRELLER